MGKLAINKEDMRNIVSDLIDAGPDLFTIVYTGDDLHIYRFMPTIDDYESYNLDMNYTNLTIEVNKLRLERQKISTDIKKKNEELNTVENAIKVLRLNVKGKK